MDLWAELDPAARIGLWKVGALDRQFEELLGRRVDLVLGQVQKPRLRANIERDGLRVFSGTMLRTAWPTTSRTPNASPPASASYIGPPLRRMGRTRDAVERRLERICEAIYRLGERAETLMPGRPWRNIRGMANRLRHAYDRIDVKVVWEAARDDVPPLAALARRALARSEGDAG